MKITGKHLKFANLLKLLTISLIKLLLKCYQNWLSVNPRDNQTYPNDYFQKYAQNVNCELHIDS